MPQGMRKYPPKEGEMTIFGLDIDGLNANTRETKKRRVTLGALYGFLGGLTFVLMAAFIDIFLHPDLPLGVDWPLLLVRFLLITLGLTVVGIVTCWAHEAWQGLFSGALAAAALALTVALVTSQVGAGLKVVVLVFILVPISAMAMPVIWLLRKLVETHAQALGLSWSGARIALLILLMAALGAWGGSFLKLSVKGVEATRFMDGLLQDLTPKQNPLHKTDGVDERASMPYELFTTDSKTSMAGYDIRIKYEDGFTLQCTVVTYPGFDPYLSGCKAQE